MRPVLAAALACDRAIRRRAVPEAIPVAGGLVIRHPGLVRVHHLNAVLVDAPPAAQPGPADVAALTERWLGDRSHRHVLFDDTSAGERAAAGLVAAGWERGRTLFMALEGEAPPVTGGADRVRAREISEAELQVLQRTALAEDVSPVDVRCGLATQLQSAQEALRAGTPARGFGAGIGDGLQSMCTLFLCAGTTERVAMIDEVGTLRAYRQRGLARAVVSAAVAAARAWGAELIVIPADADDWPQLMYGRLGFAPVGVQVSLTLRVPRLPGSGSGAV